jgi:hypothetical protein
MLFVKWKGNFNVGLHGMNSGAYMMRLVGKAWAFRKLLRWA